MLHSILSALFLVVLLFVALLVIGYYCKIDTPKRQMTPEEEKKYEIS